MTKKLFTLASAIGFGFFLIVAYVFYFSTSKMYTRSYQLLGVAFAVLFSGALSIIFRGKIAKKIKSTTPKKLYTICAVVMLFIQLFIVFFSHYTPVTDAKHLSNISVNFLNGSDNLYEGMESYNYFYLERYSNNWLLFLIETLLYKLSYSIFGTYSYIFQSLLTTICIQVAYYFFYKTATLTLDKRKSLIAILIMAFCPYLYAFSPIFYTDTISLPFVIMSIYFAVKASKESFGKKCAISLLLCGIFISIGYFLKGNIAVIGVGVLIYLVLKLDFKKAIIFVTALAISFVGVSKAVESTMYSLNVITEERVEEYKFPMSHWLMMGLNGKGGFNEQDFEFTYGISGYDEKNQADTEMIKERLGELKFTGLIKHFEEKLRYTWQQVDFQTSWQYKSTRNFIGKFFRKVPLYYSLCFIFQNVMVALMLCSYFKGIKHSDDEKFIIRISSLGLMIFLLLWETRSRYMLNFLPLYFLMMADGVDVYVGIFKKITKKFSRKKLKS